MKIALTGAHGTGKSTLANFLKNEFTKRSIIASVTPEVPRLICEAVNDKEYFRRGKNSLLKQSLILLGQLITEEQNQKGVDMQICDRTLFDHWAYSLSLFGKEISEGNYTEIYESFISQHCKTYDKVFYLPIEFKPLDDGVRESDEKFQLEIDGLILGLLKKHDINYERITGNIEGRGNAILKTLNIQ
ncbi:ATP/GTP-binding protein [Pedobacter nototheniae]|uniref:ATP/GTP-binding protein n=1 Tax=Pedobacter nototheniae TaxID=2488994 RepID=UPI00103C9C7F|nr:ATP-binding protein [Pedobacter nototheniae]